MERIIREQAACRHQVVTEVAGNNHNYRKAG